MGWLDDDAAHAQDSLCIDRIRRELSTETVGFEIHLFRKVASTGGVLERLAESGARDGAVVLAETQSGDRGWLGTPRSSRVCADLHAAVLFRPRIPRRGVRTFALIAPLAIADAIAAEGSWARVRWPNEVLADGRRVARTSTSVAPMGPIPDYVVVEVEARLNGCHPACACSGAAASLREAAGHPIDRNHFTAALLNHLERWLRVYRARGPEAIVRAWNDRAIASGELVAVAQGGPS